jgi:dephospho-CoA kinase
MLRVGLTGSLGSGKSTVAAMLRGLGAQVIEADALGRALMEPGQEVFRQIVERFGPEVLTPEGRLDRARLAQIAFGDGRVQELNAIVHPATIELQRQEMKKIFARDAKAVAVIESALIFEVVRDARARGETDTVLADLRKRLDRVVVVTAPDELKIARYAARVSPAGSGGERAREAAAADARVRLRHQIPDAEKAAQADYVLENAGSLEALEGRVRELWERLRAESEAKSGAGSNNSGEGLSLK